ncbi:hypothetical protein ALC53_01519 [Atta colombica]|uniref:Uncharacterized protein n=1 Tax=Atta colombica TaxID=520822 RepID=A0A195BTM1_9HYME|nr:hypothetical protein ALC53_01519 [Atta colombica]
MHIHISLPRRLRSGMRSIARRIESGPTRSRERPGANVKEGNEETWKRTGQRKQEGDTGRKREREVQEEREIERSEIERKISSERLRGKGKEPEEKRSGETRKPDSLDVREREREREREVEELEKEEQTQCVREKENAHGSRKRQQLLRALPLESLSA